MSQYHAIFTSQLPATRSAQNSACAVYQFFQKEVNEIFSFALKKDPVAANFFMTRNAVRLLFEGTAQLMAHQA